VLQLCVLVATYLLLPQQAISYFVLHLLCSKPLQACAREEGRATDSSNEGQQEMGLDLVGWGMRLARTTLLAGLLQTLAPCTTP